MSPSEENPLGAATGPVLDPDERGELDRLRQEVAALRAAPAPRPSRFRWASLAAAVLLVLGCVGVPASVLALWTHNQVADTDRSVATVSPVIDDPLVQSALAEQRRVPAHNISCRDVSAIRGCSGAPSEVPPSRSALNLSPVRAML